MISHEYRTPLAIIQTNIDLLELKKSGDRQILDPLGKMQRGVQRLLDIFESSRRRRGLEKRTSMPEPEPLMAEETIRDILASARDFWGDRFVCNSLPLPGCCMVADSHLFRTALLNLLDNAVKYSPGDSPVTFSCGTSGNMLQVKINNRSLYPLAENPGQLARKYQRGSNSAGTSGTGVGLYLADDIARQLGGRFSMTIDGGTEVTVLIEVPLCKRGE